MTSGFPSSKWGWILLLALVFLASRGTLLYPHDPSTLFVGSHAGHEWHYNLWRTIGMADALADGMPGRWLSTFSHHWGYPLYEYTSPLPYTLSSILFLIGFDIHSATNITWFFIFGGAGLSMFWATRPIWGYWGALLSACCYLLAPYHLVDTYVRTNMVETSAFLWPPIVLYGLWLLQSKPLKGVVTGALGISLCPLSHMLSTYMLGMALSVFCCLYVVFLPGQRLRFMAGAAAIALLGLSLSAFFWLAALLDIDAVKGVEVMTTGNYYYGRHFVLLNQLVNTYFGYGASEPGPNDYMSFSLSPWTLGLTAASVALCIVALVRQLLNKVSSEDARPVYHKSGFAISAVLTAIAMAWLTTEYSAVVWRHLPGMPAAQFPWRFLFPASFFLTIATGALPAMIARFFPRYGRPLAALVGAAGVGLILWQHWDISRAGSYGDLPYQDVQDYAKGDLGVWTTNQLEFLPAGALIPHKYAARKETAVFYDKLLVRNDGQILNSKLENGKVTINLQANSEGTLVVYQHWHPAWRASIDGRPADTFAFDAHPYAPIALAIQPGDQQVELRFGYSKRGHWGWLLSCLALLGLVGFLLIADRPLLKRFVVILGGLGALITFYGATAKPDAADLQQRIARTQYKVSADRYAEPVREGSSWDRRGHLKLDERGLWLRFDELQHGNHLNISLDSNDIYTIEVLHHKANIATLVAGVVYQPGMRSRDLFLPPAAAEQGFDSLLVRPVQGDSAYAFGHLIVDTVEQVPAEVGRVSVKQPIRANIDQLATIRNPKARWNMPGNIIMQDQGVRVILSSVRHAAWVDLSLDNNDYYLIGFIRDGQVVATAKRGPSQRRNIHDLDRYQIAVPEEAQQSGFDAVAIAPVAGDDHYALGHLTLVD